MKIRNVELEKCNGIEVGDKTIENWIKEQIEYLENNPTENFIYNLSGCNMVSSHRDGIDVLSYVTKVLLSARFEKTGGSTYCMCDETSVKIININGEDVMVCKSCKKEAI